MDSHNSDGFDALALEPLCQAAAQELLMRSYTVRTLNRYKRVGEQLADFARAQGLPAEYMRELALPLSRKNRWTNFSVPSIVRDGRAEPDQTHVSNS